MRYANASTRSVFMLAFAALGLSASPVQAFGSPFGYVPSPVYPAPVIVEHDVRGYYAPTYCPRTGRLIHYQPPGFYGGYVPRPVRYYQPPVRHYYKPHHYRPHHWRGGRHGYRHNNRRHGGGGVHIRF